MAGKNRESGGAKSNTKGTYAAHCAYCKAEVSVRQLGKFKCPACDSITQVLGANKVQGIKDHRSKVDDLVSVTTSPVSPDKERPARARPASPSPELEELLLSNEKIIQYEDLSTEHPKPNSLRGSEICLTSHRVLYRRPALLGLTSVVQEIHYENIGGMTIERGWIRWWFLLFLAGLILLPFNVVYLEENLAENATLWGDILALVGILAHVVLILFLLNHARGCLLVLHGPNTLRIEFIKRAQRTRLMLEAFETIERQILKSQ